MVNQQPSIMAKSCFNAGLFVDTVTRMLKVKRTPSTTLPMRTVTAPKEIICPLLPKLPPSPKSKCPWPSFPKSTLFFQLRLTTCLWFAQLCLWPLLLPSVTAITLLIPTITAMLTPSTDSHSSIRISSYSYTQLKLDQI